MSLASSSAAGTAAATTKKYTRSRGRAKKAEPADPYASPYGVVPYDMFRGGPWTRIDDLGEAAAPPGAYVRIFGTLWSVRPVSRTRAVVVVLNFCSTVRCVVDAAAALAAAGDENDGSGGAAVSTRMVRFASTMSTGYTIDVEGVVSVPESRNGRPRRLATTKQVEIQVRKIHPIGPGVPFQLQPQDRRRKSQRHCNCNCNCKSVSTTTPTPPVKQLEDNDNAVEAENQAPVHSS